ncbi:MAG: hypothetical protein ACOYMZ_02685 [Minisyncoccia bacterium]
MFNFFKSNKKSKSASEVEFADISLSIKNVSFENGKTILDVILSERDIGFRIIVQDKTSKVTFDENGKPTVVATPNGVIFKSQGKRSNDFLVFLSKEYGYEQADMVMANELSMTSVAMEGDCSNLDSEPIRFKLFNDRQFLDQDSSETEYFYENEYFEIFLIIDILNNKVELSEKDVEYRSSILKSLSSQIDLKGSEGIRE